MSVNTDRIAGLARQIGSRIQKRRASRGLTLQELARKSGISASMISKIENSRCLPPISTYAKIAEGLGLAVEELIVENRDHSDLFSIVRAAERTIISHGPYIGSPLAFRKSSKKMEPFLLSYPVGRSFSHLNTHHFEEMIYIIEGSIEFRYGEKTFVLEKGDCIYYDGRIPHAGRAIDPQGATALVVQSRD
jgi:transcriptional regulator with XRE-family HTH domain